MHRIIAVLMSMLPLCAAAQNNTQPEQPAYPQDYFRNPLNIPIFLAGNFGECRPGHFHSGMDIKTLGKENQPVHAAASGYISRIKMEKGGFGHALYITHPNGYTTLYAHLNDFVPLLEKYLKKEQYQKRHWDVDIQLTPDQFPVKKGQQIAWSGNTGASTAPHLHFEIRDTQTEHPLNPEQFGLPVTDTVPPLPTELVVYENTGTDVGFYNMPRHLFTLRKKGHIYAPGAIEGDDKNIAMVADTIDMQNAGNIGVGIQVDDHMEGSDNTIAFYSARLTFDDSLQSEIILDDIGYDETRYVNAYADYELKQKDDKWVQCFFKLPGNHLDDIYRHLENDGWLHWDDKQVHKVVITFTDDKGNSSDVLFFVRAQQAGMQRVVEYPATLITFQANKPNVLDRSDISCSLDNRALYAKISFVVQNTPFNQGYSDKILLGYPYVPVHTYFDLKLKPVKQVPETLQNNVVMMYSDGKDEDGRAATVTDNGWYKARVRNFGTYWLETDEAPPVIKPLQKNNSNLHKAKEIAFEVKDDKTSVKTFSGYLDGKWICFEQHNNLFFYRFDEHCPKGKHKLVFKAADENGNEAEYKLNFVR